MHNAIKRPFVRLITKLSTISPIHPVKNPDTGILRAKCNSNQILNPLTGRCILKTKYTSQNPFQSMDDTNSIHLTQLSALSDAITTFYFY
jgi:hypothetical protein